MAGPYVRQACERHLAERARPISADWPWRFDEGLADLVLNFFSGVLRLPDTADEEGNPKPFVLEPALAFIVGSLMGWVGQDGYRRFREGYAEMGKGNAKTPTLAGLGLYGLKMDGELAAEIYAAAVTREQSKILWTDAAKMVKVSPELTPLITETVNNLADTDTFSFFRPYSRDQGVKSGPRPHFALIDEVHEHPSAEVINKLKAGFKFRKQPLAVMITNSGFDRTSICFQIHQHAERILAGHLRDDRFFAYVCALDEGDDPLTDESCWIKTNPLIGVTITHEYLRRQVENAKHIPSEMNTVLRLNFCIWTNQRSRAIDMGKWAACQTTVSEDDLLDAPCFAGLDLGMSDDLCAFVRIWPLDDGRVAVKCRFWIPEAAIAKFPNRPYDEWKRLGVLDVTEGEITDYTTVQDVVEQECLASGVRTLAYDPRFANQMAQNLQGRGITVVATPQGFQLNEATKRLLELVAEEQLCCEGNPILTIMASNFVVRHGKYKEIRPDKDAANEKIDGIVALAMAIDQGIVRNPGSRSIYDAEDAEVFVV